MSNKLLKLNESELAVIAVVMNIHIAEQQYVMQEGLEDGLAEMQEGLNLMEKIVGKVNRAMGVGIPGHVHSGPLTLQ